MKLSTLALLYSAALPSCLSQTVYRLCGGGRGNACGKCDEGYLCLAPPYACGESCDDPGICISDAEENWCGFWEEGQEFILCGEGKSCFRSGYYCDPNTVTPCFGWCIEPEPEIDWTCPGGEE